MSSNPSLSESAFWGGQTRPQQPTGLQTTQDNGTNIRSRAFGLDPNTLTCVPCFADPAANVCGRNVLCEPANNQYFNCNYISEHTCLTAVKQLTKQTPQAAAYGAVQPNLHMKSVLNQPSYANAVDSFYSTL